MALELDRLRHAFRALRHRNFRLFASGQFVSLVGTWMQTVALGWYVYRLTRDPFLLGLVGFLGQVPSLGLSPLAGVWADRWNRHRMVIGTQVLAAMQAFALSALVLTGKATVVEILALALFLGLVNAVDVPARQSFLVEMVAGSEDLANAIALNSSIFNVARLVGPAVAGALIGLIGEGPVFLANAVSYVAVIAALLGIHIERPRAPARDPAPVWAHLREGLAYVAGFAPMRDVLLLLAVVGLVGFPYQVLLPVFAKDVLGGGPDTLGSLVGAVGVGALAGALYLASRRSVRGLGRVIVVAVALFSLALAAFAVARSRWVVLPALAVAGFGMMLHMASSNTIIQTLVEADKRGRVMSLYTVAVMGTAPLGNLLSGALAARIGAPWTVFSGATASLVAGALFARALPRLRAQVRPIYVRLGVIPAVAAGLQTADEAAALEPPPTPRDHGARVTIAPSPHGSCRCASRD